MYRPWVGRRFGVEMEMNDVTVEQARLTAQALRDAVRHGVTQAGGNPQSRVNRAAPGYYHSNGGTWDVKTDSSCGYGGGNGWEIASPAMALDEEGECDELREVTTAIKALRPRIDRSCGLHVHVEVTDYTWQDLQRLVALWMRYEPFFFELVPQSRRTNQYCTPMRRATWGGGDSHVFATASRLATATAERATRDLSVSTGRGALHLGHFWRSQRIEFRLAGGTVEYEKIVRWVQLLLTLVQRVKQPWPIATGNYSTEPLPIAFVAKVLGLLPMKHVRAADIPQASAKLLDWIIRRHAQFQRGGDAIDQAANAAGRRV